MKKYLDIIKLSLCVLLAAVMLAACSSPIASQPGVSNATPARQSLAAQNIKVTVFEPAG